MMYDGFVVGLVLLYVILVFVFCRESREDNEQNLII